MDVYWPADSRYYTGKAISVNKRGLVNVLYDDGEVEVLDFGKERWRVCASQPPSPQPPSNASRSSAPAKPPSHLASSVTIPPRGSPEKLIPLTIRSLCQLLIVAAHYSFPIYLACYPSHQSLCLVVFLLSLYLASLTMNTDAAARSAAARAARLEEETRGKVIAVPVGVFLRQVPILAKLTEHEILTIADALREESFSAGKVICSQGDTGETFYIVKSGTAVCTQKNANGEEGEVARLSSGSYFGEIALLTSKPRQATVTVVRNLKCLTLDRETFRRVMDPTRGVMSRSIEGYKKFQAASI